MQDNHGAHGPEPSVCKKNAKNAALNGKRQLAQDSPMQSSSLEPSLSLSPPRKRCKCDNVTRFTTMSDTPVPDLTEVHAQFTHTLKPSSDALMRMDRARQAALLRLKKLTATQQSGAQLLGHARPLPCHQSPSSSSSSSSSPSASPSDSLSNSSSSSQSSSSSSLAASSSSPEAVFAHAQRTTAPGIPPRGAGLGGGGGVAGGGATVNQVAMLQHQAYMLMRMPGIDPALRQELQSRLTKLANHHARIVIRRLDTLVHGIPAANGRA